MKRVIQILAVILLISGYSKAQTFTLKSDDIGGQMIKETEFNGFGCSGTNQSPQLSWENAPEGTKSFAVVMYDKDAPTGSGWWHWIVFNLPKELTELPTNAGDPKANLLPASAVQAKTDYGAYGYGGPCPPKGHGFHEYKITVYALKLDQLELDADASSAKIGYFLNHNALAKASIIAYYKRD